MKNMKKSIKCLIALMIMAMAFCVTGVNAQAAKKTQKVTFFVGEKIQHSFIGMGKVKSVKSSNSKVVTAKKYKSGIVTESKKKGKATITTKGTRGSYVYKVTVKNPDIKVSLPTNLGDSVVSVKNDGSGYFDSISVLYHLYDAAGNELGTEREFYNCVGSKKIAYGSIYLSKYRYANADFSKTTYEINWNRSLRAKFKDYTKKVKFTATESNGKVNVKTSMSYKGKGYVYAGYSVFFYDAAGNVVEVRDSYHFLYKKQKTKTYSISKPNDAVSWKLVNKRAYLETR